MIDLYVSGDLGYLMRVSKIVYRVSVRALEAMHVNVGTATECRERKNKVLLK